MKKLKVLFGIHNHQPVGNFEHVFEELYQKCYRPYLDVLKDFPILKTSVHFTGPLLEWLKKNHPDLIGLVRDLVSEKRLEIISGGFYEPILSSLPEDDAIGQIQMMNEFIQTEFDYSPRGLWLAERIWSPDLPKIISAAGLKYTILDDTHFYYAGLEEKQIKGYFITEKTGTPLNIFPISKALRYSVPFELPEKTIERLKHFKDDLDFDAITYADDGEKFGGWPDTYKWVYEEKYLRNFFTSLEENRDWLEMITFSEYLEISQPTGRIYLPLASYEEMMGWSLPSKVAMDYQQLKGELLENGISEERSKTFLRGGQWDNFLTKYEEVNNLHKKMLYVSDKVRNFTGPKEIADSARRELYQAQCNCAQWHGLFGGLYLNYLRHALYQHLIAAENIIHAASNGKESDLKIEFTDINLDGLDEVIVSNNKMYVGIMPAYGGAVFELDYRPACFNISNVLRRRIEPYHQTIRDGIIEESQNDSVPKTIHDAITFKEEGLQNELIYDRYERYSFIDHCLSPETTFENFKDGNYEELGNFAGQPYEVISPTGLEEENNLHLTMQRNGLIINQGIPNPIHIKKSYEFTGESASVNAKYKITNEGNGIINFRFGVEFNLTLLAKDAVDRYYTLNEDRLPDGLMKSEGELTSVEKFALHDDWSKFVISFLISEGANLWRFPVETVSQSEGGYEKTYQGSCVLIHWDITLNGSKTTELEIGFDVR
ncbi:MAG: alpha-amylase/4-alpha-glucanotransferase domain-containing protein [Nitrospinales bacterium]